MKNYLTVQEFIDTGETRSDIIIECKRDYFDGLGKRYRCDCTGPVSNIKFSEKRRGLLTWGDFTGDPRVSGITKDTIMKDLTSEGEWYYSVYTIEKK